MGSRPRTEFCLDELKRQKGQKVIFLNARSVYSHLCELQVEFNRTNFVALCLSETWLNVNLPSGIVKIEGFNLIRQDRAYVKRGGGVAIYLREDFEWEPLPHDCHKSDTNIEIFSIIVKRKFLRNLYLSIVYLPPKANLTAAISYVIRFRLKITIG